MSKPLISFFGAVLEGEALNTEDDYAKGVVFFALMGNERTYGGCIRFKQVVGSSEGDLPLELSAPLAWEGPDFDHALLADIVRWYWETTRSAKLESLIGGSRKILGSVLGVNLSLNFDRQLSMEFSREALEVAQKGATG